MLSFANIPLIRGNALNRTHSITRVQICRCTVLDESCQSSDFYTLTGYAIFWSTAKLPSDLPAFRKPE